MKRFGMMIVTTALVSASACVSSVSAELVTWSPSSVTLEDPGGGVDYTPALEYRVGPVTICCPAGIAQCTFELDGNVVSATGSGQGAGTVTAGRSARLTGPQTYTFTLHATCYTVVTVGNQVVVRPSFDDDPVLTVNVTDQQACASYGARSGCCVQGQPEPCCLTSQCASPRAGGQQNFSPAP